ncbi:MAG: nucleotide exchange factor GrpE [Pseudomonadota bacterium]
MASKKDSAVAEDEAAAAAEAKDEAATDAAPEAAAEGETDVLNEADLDPETLIAALTAERDALKDRLLRALAEAENARKRGDRDRRDAEAYGSTRLARDLLPVYDNLGRALEAADEDLRALAGPIMEGVELTQKELLSALAKSRITPIRPEIGERFDPNRHQAMFEAPVADVAEGCVCQVMLEGFEIADRLLRPAQVGVSSGAPAES